MVKLRQTFVALSQVGEVLHQNGVLGSPFRDSQCSVVADSPTLGESETLIV